MSVPEASYHIYETGVNDPYPIVHELRRKLLDGTNITYISPATWDAIREVLASNHPYGYQAVVQILRILQIRQLLFRLENGMIVNGVVMLNCPPDLRQTLLNIFRDEQLFRERGYTQDIRPYADVINVPDENVEVDDGPVFMDNGLVVEDLEGEGLYRKRYRKR
jgi:hypothetical protein